MSTRKALSITLAVAAAALLSVLSTADASFGCCRANRRARTASAAGAPLFSVRRDGDGDGGVGRVGRVGGGGGGGAALLPTTKSPLVPSRWRVCRRDHLADNPDATSPFCIPPQQQRRDGAAGIDAADADDDAPPRRLGSQRGWSPSAYEDALALHDRLTKCDDEYIAPLIERALDVLGQAYRLYGPESVVGSYNGGKDAVVILHLMRAAYAKFVRDEMEEEVASPAAVAVDADADGADESPRGSSEGEGKAPTRPTPSLTRPRVIYFEHADEFPEVLDLLRDTVHRFDLDMLAFEEGIKFGEGLQMIVDTNYLDQRWQRAEAATNGEPIRPTMHKSEEQNRRPRPYPMAFVLGTRSSDPNAGTQGTFAPSSTYMPPFMRVNPVLDWSYGHVWHFLRAFDLPYCSLYDLGYTSLGTTKDTLPCPALAKDGEKEDDDDRSGDGGAVCDFFPAYMLKDYDQERAGRIKKDEKKKAKAKR